MCGPPPAPGPSAESSLSWVMAFRKCKSMTHGQKEVLFIELMSFSHSHLYENRESKGFCLKPSYVYLSSWPFLYPCLSPSQKPLVSLAWRLLLVWLSSAERVKKKKNWWVAFWVIYNGFCLYVGADGIWRLLLHFMSWFWEKVWNSVQWIWTVKYAIIANKSVVLSVVLYAIKLAKIFHKLHVVSKWWVFEFCGLGFSDKLYHLTNSDKLYLFERIVHPKRKKGHYLSLKLTLMLFQAFSLNYHDSSEAITDPFLNSLTQWTSHSGLRRFAIESNFYGAFVTSFKASVSL